MNNFNRPSELIVELATAVVAEMRTSYPDWNEAFVRLQAEDGSFEVKCSYVLPTGVQILNVLAHKAFIENAHRIGAELREKLPRANGPFCVGLLRVGADLDYSMQYEYGDPDRWSISKIDGSSGIPAGYSPA
jgi:hypothetical protein